LSVNGSSGNRVDIAQLFDSGRWSALGKTAFVLGCLAYAVDGLANHILGPAIPAMVQDWGVDRTEFALLPTVGLVGMAVGTIFFGTIGDRLGRKPALVGSIILFSLASMLIAAADSVPQLFILRFLDGIGLGGALPLATTVIADMTPLRRRGLAISAAGVFIGFGGLAASLLATGMLPTMGWRALFLTAGALGMAVAAATIFMLPESPRFLVRRPHRRPELLKVLRRSGLDVKDDAEFVDGAAPPGKVPLSTILGSELRRDTLGLWGLIFFCLLSSYSLLFWLPSMLQDRGFGLDGTSLGFAGWSTGAIFAAFFVAALLQWFGTRITFLVVTGGGAIGAFLLGAYPFSPEQGVTVMMVALGIESVFVTGTQTAFYALSAYVYAPPVRSTGVGVALAWGRLGAMLGAFISPFILQSGGSAGYFGLVGGSLVMAFLMVLVITRHAPAGRKS